MRYYQVCNGVCFVCAVVFQSIAASLKRDHNHVVTPMLSTQGNTAAPPPPPSPGGATQQQQQQQQHALTVNNAVRIERSNSNSSVLSQTSLEVQSINSHATGTGDAAAGAAADTQSATIGTSGTATAAVLPATSGAEDTVATVNGTAVDSDIKPPGTCVTLKSGLLF